LLEAIEERQLQRSLSVRASGFALLLLVCTFVLPTADARANTGFWLGAGGSVAAGAYYGYPYPHAPDCNETSFGGCANDKWGFTQGQCTSWVAYQLSRLNVAAFSNTYGQRGGRIWGDATQWSAAAARAGIAVDGTPGLGSIAWYAGGHLAYVEHVNSPTSVVVSEMNIDSHNGFEVRTITTASGWPNAFIHVNDRRPPIGSGRWEGVTGSLVQIDVGAGEVWGVNSAGTVYNYAGGGKWTARGSGFKSVSAGTMVGASQHVYAVRTNGSVVRWLPGHGWERVAGNLAQIDVGVNEVWGVNSAGNVFSYGGGGKWTSRGSGFKNVSAGTIVSGAQDVYAVRTNGSVVRWVPGRGWEAVAGKLTQVDVGYDEIWGVNSAGNVFAYVGGGRWAQKSSSFRDISAGTSGAGPQHVYGVRTNRSIVRWLPT
jgi:surface antigen